MPSRRLNHRRLRRWAIAAAARPEVTALPPLEVERVCDWVVRKLDRGLALYLQNSRCANHRDVVLGLVDRSYRLRLESPEAGLRWARAAVEVAEGLRLGRHYARLEADLRAQAWGNLANTQRILGAFNDAEEAWAESDRHWLGGTADPLLEADLAAKRGSLYFDQKKLPEATALVTNAVALRDKLNEPHLAAKARILLGFVLNRSGDPGSALEVSSRASLDLDFGLEPEVGFALVHNALIYLEADGDLRTALLGSRATRWLYQIAGSPLLQHRASWMRGRLTLADGEPDRAVPELEEAKRGFLSLDLPYPAALAGLELALAYARQSEPLKVVRLAHEMYPVFTSLRIPQEAAAVLVLFAKTAKSLHVEAQQIAAWVAQLTPLRRAYERGEVAAPAAPADLD